MRLGGASANRTSKGDRDVKLPIVIHSDEDYDRAQQRVKELNAKPDTPDKEKELQALAEAMLSFELRREDADD